MPSEIRAGRWKRALKTQEVIRDLRNGAQYAIVRLIGRGGYSEVYEVIELKSGQKYALKCLRLKHSEDPRAIERARREGAALWRLRHPNVVRCHALGVREDGLVWMVMDLLVGRTVRELIRAVGRVPIAWSLQIAIGVCDGLRAVHTVCVHRDLKPENLHISDDGTRICLFDLGVGKFPQEQLLTTGEMTLGTVSYMSPEQLERPAQIDPRSDLFALGVLLYELLSGVNPFNPEGLGADDRMAIGLRIITAPFRPLREVAPWVPGYVAHVVEVALCKDRDKRFPTAAAMSRGLEAALKRYIEERGPSAPLGLVGSLPHEASQFDSEEEFRPKAEMAIPVSVNPFVTAPLDPTRASAAGLAGNGDVGSTRPSYAAIELRRFSADEVEQMARTTGAAVRVVGSARESLPLGEARGAEFPASQAQLVSPKQSPDRSVDAAAQPASAGLAWRSGRATVKKSMGDWARLALAVVTAVVVALAGIRFVEWARASTPADPVPTTTGAKAPPEK